MLVECCAGEQSFALQPSLMLRGGVFLRSAGCVFNDLSDAGYDKQIELTKNTPLASSQIRRTWAMLTLVSLLVGGQQHMHNATPIEVQHPSCNNGLALYTAVM